MTGIKSFYKETVPVENRNIIKAEYFFNTDPGVGKGQPLALIPATDISGLTFVAEVQNLPLGTNRLYVRAMDADGRWSLTNIHAFSVECSQVTVDFQVQNGCAGMQAEFVDLSTNTHPEAEYRWDFGDGSPLLITGRGNVSHTYSHKGDFQAKLIVKNRTDCIDSITHNITINKPPFVEAGANLTVCEGSEVVLNAVYEFGTLSWDHGVVNGMPFVPETSTTYTATVLSEFGCGSVTDQIMVTLTENPEVFAGEDAIGCQNEGFLISSAFVRNAASVIWETTNGSGYFDDAGIVNTTYFPSSQDPQIVGLCLTALPLNPCTLSATGCFNLLITQAVWVTIETPTNDDTICAGTVLQLQAAAGNSGSCLWNTSGDGVFSSPTELLTTYTPGDNDIFGQHVELCIECFPTFDCTIPATACITLQVSPDPVVVLEPEIWLDCADFDFDENQWLPVQLSAMPENVSSLFWTTTGDGYFSNPSHTETAYFIGENDALSNHVHLTVTASGAGLCGITDSESVNIYIPKQMIPVEKAGWRGLSSFMDMSGQSMAEVLGPVSQHLLIIRDDQNHTYTPGTGINTIGNWSATGYMANFKNPPTCLPLYGEPVTNKIIHIGKQITYLPVLNDRPITIEELFAGHLEKIQSVYDWSTFKTWTPSNPTFNLLKPGFAYQLTLLNPDSDFHIEYPPYSWEELPASLFISGKISNQESNEPVEGVEIVVSGQPSVFTNVDGIFRAAVPRNWSGTVSAIKPDWEFSPLSRSINNAVVNIFDQDFTGIDNSCNAGWSVVYTPSFHTFIIPLAAQPGIFGEPDEANDFIGVFYTDDQNTEQCGGFAQWTGHGDIQVDAFGDDPYSPEKDGFSENEPVKWKMFSCSKIEYFSAHATYDPFMPQSSGIFENYGFSVLTSLQAQICQEFFFNQNWNDLSLFVSPFDPDVAEIFAQMENNLVIFKNLTSFYWPQNAINTVGNWDLNSGYVLKTSAPESIVVCGIPLGEHSLQYSTSQGYWRYLPVLTSCALNCDELFGPVAGKITIVKDLIGTGVWWPEMGIYSLGELLPGQAYEIKIKENVTITFPVCDAKAVAKTVAQPNFTTSPWGDIAASPNTHTIAVPSEVAAMLAEGAVIGVFDNNGNITGASQVTGKHSFTISVSGNDVTTTETEGMEEGSPMFFQLFDPLSGNYFALEVTFDENLPQKGFFTNQGLSAIKSLQATGIVNVDKTNPELLVFPNPSDGLFDVSLKTPVNTHFRLLWEVHNCQGSMVAGGKTESSDFVINLTYQPKGIYYLRIVTEGWQTVRKLVVQ